MFDEIEDLDKQIHEAIFDYNASKSPESLDKLSKLITIKAQLALIEDMFLNGDNDEQL